MKKSILIIFLFIIIAIIAWTFTEHKPALAPTIPTELESNNYTNSTYNFSALLPEGFKAEEDYIHFLPADGEIKGVRFVVPESMTEGTNLSNDTAITVESLPTSEACSALLFTDFKDNAPQNITDGGKTYSFLTFSDAGAGNRYEESIYAIPGKSPCLAIRYFIHYGAIQNYPEGSVKEFNKQNLLKTFGSIRRSLKQI